LPEEKGESAAEFANLQILWWSQLLSHQNFHSELLLGPSG
jgi:hypothetical protein